MHHQPMADSEFIEGYSKLSTTEIICRIEAWPAMVASATDRVYANRLLDEIRIMASILLDRDRHTIKKRDELEQEIN